MIRFQQDHGIKQKVEEPGLKYTLDFGLGMLKSVLLGDALNDLAHSIRPFEVYPGETDRVMDECLKDLLDHLRTYRPEQIAGEMPTWLLKHSREGYSVGGILRRSTSCVDTCPGMPCAKCSPGAGNGSMASG